jgi:acyl CoA:acetate/3-ketoacid CoA transferase
MMVLSIQEERRRSHLTKVWANFGLSLVLCILFFVTSAGHGVVQWQRYAAEQRTHGDPVEVSGYLVDYGESTGNPHWRTGSPSSFNCSRSWSWPPRTSTEGVPSPGTARIAWNRC